MAETRYRGIVTVVDTGLSASFHVRGPAEVVAELARDLDLPKPEWSGTGGGYRFPRRRLVDAVAWLEWQNYKVRVARRRRRDLPEGVTGGEEAPAGG